MRAAEKRDKVKMVGGLIHSLIPLPSLMYIPLPMSRVRKYRLSRLKIAGNCEVGRATQGQKFSEEKEK